MKAKNDLVKGWDRDIPAYKRLVADGLQPAHVDGCADLEAVATDREQIQADTFDPIVSDA